MRGGDKRRRTGGYRSYGRRIKREGEAVPSWEPENIEPMESGSMLLLRVRGRKEHERAALPPPEQDHLKQFIDAVRERQPTGRNADQVGEAEMKANFPLPGRLVQVITGGEGILYMNGGAVGVAEKIEPDLTVSAGCSSQLGKRTGSGAVHVAVSTTG